MERKRGLEHLDVDVTPQEAQKRLKTLGLSKRTWSVLTQERGFASHELAALAHIALSQSPKNLKDEYVKQRNKDTS